MERVSDPSALVAYMELVETLQARLLEAVLHAGGSIHRCVACCCVVSVATRLVPDDAASDAEASVLARIDELGRDLLGHAAVATRLVALTSGWSGSDSRGVRKECVEQLCELFVGRVCRGR